MDIKMMMEVITEHKTPLMLVLPIPAPMMLEIIADKSIHIDQLCYRKQSLIGLSSKYCELIGLNCNLSNMYKNQSCPLSLQ